MIDENRCLHSQNQIVHMPKTYAETARILDIGGGGEGILGKLYGKQVVSIDRLAEELEETKNESLKIEMDASQMKFVDRSFEVVTSFFTFMYMDDDVKKKVIHECYRVLKAGGMMEVWDIEIPPYLGGEKDIYLANLEIILPKETIKTVYGVLMKFEGQNLNLLTKLCEDAGFTVVLREQKQEVFRLQLKKIEA